MFSSVIVVYFSVLNENNKMKKIYTLLLATLGVSVAATAQRYADLDVTLVAPANASTIESGSQVSVVAQIKNLGTDTVRTTDTLLYAYRLNGQILPFTNPNNPSAPAVTVFGVTLTNPLPPDSSFEFTPSPFTVTFPAATNGNHEFCIEVQAVNRSIDSLVDTVAANNLGCSNVEFAGGEEENSVITLSFASGTRSVISAVYPNPATTSATFALNLVQNQNVTVKVVDLAGRVVLHEDKGTMLKGENEVTVNTNGLTPGLYLYQVIMGNHTATGKLNVAK